MCWWPTPEPVAYLVGVRGVGKISVTLSRPPVGVLHCRGVQKLHPIPLSRPPVGVLGVPTPEPVACLVCVSGARVPVCHQIERPARWCAGGPAPELAARLPMPCPDRW